MTAKEYMQQIQNLDAAIQMLEGEIRRIQREIRGMDEITIRAIWPDGQPHGTGISDPVTNEALKGMTGHRSERMRKLREQMVDLKIKHSKKRAELAELRAEVIETLMQVESPSQKMLLYRVYVDGARIEQVAKEVGYSQRHTTRLHRDALQAVDEILDKNAKKQKCP